MHTSGGTPQYKRRNPALRNTSASPEMGSIRGFYSQSETSKSGKESGKESGRFAWPRAAALDFVR